MAGFDEVMERLITDPRFREELVADVASALSGYDLTDKEVRLLASGVVEGEGQGKVEQRTSKAGLAGILGAFGAGSPGDQDLEAGGSSTSRRGEEIDLQSWTFGPGAAGPPDGDYVLTDVGHSARSPGGGYNEIVLDDTKGKEATDTGGSRDVVVKGSKILQNATSVDAGTIGSPQAGGSVEEADHGNEESSNWARVGQPWAGSSSDPSSGTNEADTLVTAPGPASPGEDRRNDIAMEEITLSHEGISDVDDRIGGETITMHPQHQT